MTICNVGKEEAVNSCAGGFQQDFQERFLNWSLIAGFS